MTSQKKTEPKLENFNDLWSLGYPKAVEEKLHELLPQAKALKNKSIYLQILSQIALAQALQRKFDAAHKTLDDAETLLTPEYELAQARILLERGRVFHQAEKITKAREFFEKSFAISSKHKFTSYAIDAAHMVAIVAEKPEEKIIWNQRALTMAESAKDKKARIWFGSLYNNLGQNYLQAQQFEKALEAFKKALLYRKKEKYAPNIRVARWAIACALRSLNRLDEALIILHKLIIEYDAINRTRNFDMPEEIFKLARGLVYAELAEIYIVKAKNFANSAYEDLSHDEMFTKMEPKRLKRLQQIIAA